MQCGAACLRMICLHYKRDISFQKISRYCRISKSGISLGGLMKAAVSLGFEASCRLVDISDLNDSDLPCIIHWMDDHFVVLYIISAGRFFIADPGRGKFSIGREDFCECWGKTADSRTGIVLFLFPNADFDRITSEINSSDLGYRAFNVIGKLFMKYKKYFILIIIGLVLSCLIQLLLPFFS